MKDWIPAYAGMNGEIPYVPLIPAKAGIQIRGENLIHAAASAAATGSTTKRYLRPRESVAHQPSRSSSQP
jgi:hypothetical protein